MQRIQVFYFEFKTENVCYNNSKNMIGSYDYASLLYTIHLFNSLAHFVYIFFSAY